MAKTVREVEFKFYTGPAMAYMDVGSFIVVLDVEDNNPPDSYSFNPIDRVNVGTYRKKSYARRNPNGEKYFETVYVLES